MKAFAHTLATLALGALLTITPFFTIPVRATVMDSTNQPTLYQNLPACTSNRDMSQAAITDGPTSPTFGQIVTAGGSTGHLILICNGTASTPAWIVAAGGTGGGSGGGSVHMTAPTGYTAANLFSEDFFSTTTLDTTKWNNGFGDSHFGQFQDNGLYPGAVTGVNCTTGNTYPSPSNCPLIVAYYDPYPYGGNTQLVAGLTPLTRLSGAACGTETNCIAITAAQSSYFASGGHATNGTNIAALQWSSATITGHTNSTSSPLMRLTGCNTGGRTSCYVQVRAQMGECRYGGWSSIWFLSDAAWLNAGGGNLEIDLQECGLNTTTGQAIANRGMNVNMHNGGTQSAHQIDTGVDLTAGYHIYGMEYTPGVSIKMYFDGTLQWTYTTNCTGISNCSVFNMPTSDYELIIDQEVANPQIDSSGVNVCGFHTCPDGIHNGPFTHYVNDVQIYRK